MSFLDSLAQRSGAQTRDRLLDAAERLFAEGGLAGVSTRAITKAAEANVGAINYYFGSKEGLISALFERRLKPLTDQRLAALEAAEKETGAHPPTVERVLEAFIRPVVEHALDPKWGSTSFAKLMGRLISEAGPNLAQLKESHFDRLRARFEPALLRAMPSLTQEELVWQMTFIVGSLHYLLLMIDHTFPCCLDQHPDCDTQVRRLVRFSSAALKAA